MNGGQLSSRPGSSFLFLTAGLDGLSRVFLPIHLPPLLRMREEVRNHCVQATLQPLGLAVLLFIWLKCEVDGIFAAAPWAFMIQLSVLFSQIYQYPWYQTVVL